jgi:hypothetical protein
MSSTQASERNVRTWRKMISEKVQVAATMRPKVAMLTSGMDRSVVAMKRGNARGARGAGHPLYDPFIVANRQRDEPLGCSGGRQPSSGGTSRMTGDRLVRICESSRVKFEATWQCRTFKRVGSPPGRLLATGPVSSLAGVVVTSRLMRRHESKRGGIAAKSCCEGWLVSKTPDWKGPRV